MKKAFVCFVMAVCMGLGTICASADAPTQITIDGQLCDIPAEYGSVYEEGGRTFVPLRFVSETLKCAVTWDDTDQMIVILSNSMSDIFTLQSGSPYLFHQNVFTGAAERIEMDVPTYYNEEECRNYIPVRFLAEAMGYEVGYDDATGIVSLTKKVE